MIMFEDARYNGDLEPQGSDANFGFSGFSFSYTPDILIHALCVRAHPSV